VIHYFGWRFLFLIASLGLLANCSKPTSNLANSASPSPSPAIPAATPVADNFACTLLTKEEAQAVQGEPYKDTKPTGH